MKNIFAAVVSLYLLAVAYSYNLIMEDSSIPSFSPFIDPVNYPVRLTYIDRFNQWWPPSAIA